MDIITAIAVSLHLGFTESYNIIHPHIRLQQDSTIAGVYYNSERNISFYGGIEKKLNNMLEGSAIEFGVVTGYSGLELAPYVRATYKNFFIASGYEKDKIVGAIIGYELKF